MANIFTTKKKGIVTSTKSEIKAPLQHFFHHSCEFDAIGLPLLITSLALSLLPFN
ncbi:hypothetical protein V8C35DRAFT_312171 [Trichoderma chlorosporum]